MLCNSIMYYICRYVHTYIFMKVAYITYVNVYMLCNVRTCICVDCNDIWMWRSPG